MVFSWLVIMKGKSHSIVQMDSVTPLLDMIQALIPLDGEQDAWDICPEGIHIDLRKMEEDCMLTITPSFVKGQELKVDK